MNEPELDARTLQALMDLRALPQLDPVARARLAKALAGERRHRQGVFVMTRMHALLAASVVLVALALAWWTAMSPHSSSESEAHTPVQFVLVAPGATSVGLAGDFNGWNPDATPLARGDGGVWSVVLDLSGGAFAYSFVVDGREWRADPAAPAAGEDFGRPSSVVLVTTET